MVDKIQILIVEDRHDDAEIMAFQLESDGLVVEWERVESAEAFLPLLTPAIDVILSDYTMPRFGAADALKLLQASGLDTPLIVVTGTISEEVAVACMKLGAADYLLKDRLSRLGEAVRHVIAQRDLRRAQHKSERDLIVLGRAIETSTNGMVLTDINGLITFANHAVLELWEIADLQVLLGKPLNDLLRLPVDGFQPFEVLQYERTSTGEINSFTANGQRIILHYTASQVIDQGGQLICLMFTFINTTEQKKAELLRIELERERELRELRSRFLSMIVHDFRNPLVSLQSALAYIKNHTETISKEQVRDRILSALTQTKHINGLIDDVLQIGEVEYFANIFAPKPVDLVEFCRTIINDFEQSLDSGKYTIKFSSELPTLIYPVDTGLLQRAIRNLLSNAIKYSPSGELVEFEIEVNDQFVTLRVKDHGIGIPTADQKRIFDGFYRATNVGEIVGSGLGLATVKQVVEIHRGTVSIESQLERGTTFILRFPG